VRGWRMAVRSRGMRSGRQIEVSLRLTLHRVSYVRERCDGNSRLMTISFPDLHLPHTRNTFFYPYTSLWISISDLGLDRYPLASYALLSTALARRCRGRSRRRSPSPTSTLTTTDDSRMTPMMYTLNFFIASKCGYTNPFADEATTLIFDKL
jgi:hypothetical protein